MNNSAMHWAVFGIEIVLTYGLIAWMRSNQRGRPEPWSFIFKILALGTLTAIISAIIQLKYSFNIPQLELSNPSLVERYGSWLQFLNNISASLIEELAKYMIGVFSLLSTRHTHKMSDTILYLVIIGLGFSLIEDAIFLLNRDTEPILRLMSFYLHSGTSAIIGYGLGRYKFGLAGYKELFFAVISAVGLHFVFNFTTTLESAVLSQSLSFGIAVFITLQIFILFRRALVEEYGLEMRARRIKYMQLLHDKSEPSKTVC